MDSLHQCAAAFLRSVASSRRSVEVVYWIELLDYTIKEAQLEITHAQAKADPEWARKSMARLDLNLNQLMLGIPFDQSVPRLGPEIDAEGGRPDKDA